MSETTEKQGRAPGLYDEQLQRQLQEKHVCREEEREALVRDMPLFAGMLGNRQGQEQRPERQPTEHKRAGE